MMTHKKWVQWRLVILGPSHCTILTGKWETTPVYVGEVAVGNVTEDQLQDVINKVSKTMIAHNQELTNEQTSSADGGG